MSGSSIIRMVHKYLFSEVFLMEEAQFLTQPFFS